MKKILGQQSILNSVAVIAYLGHAGQVDKAGTPYKFHIAKVVSSCKSFDAKVVAYLYDICEDLHVEMKALKETGLLTEKQIDAINLLNKFQLGWGETVVNEIRKELFRGKP